MTDSAAPSELLDLGGRAALVTGGAGGIGRSIVSLLLAAGAEVVSVDREGAVSPTGAQALACDLSDRQAIRALRTTLAADWPKLDIFVDCAGITRDGVTWKLGEEKWGEVMRVNLDAAFHLMAYVIPAMRAAGAGSVVFVSSINGERGKFGQSNYAASKAGLAGLAKSLAREVGRFGIRSNVVAPGFIRTEMTRDLPEEFVMQAVAETALGHVGEPEDVARAVLFLCSGLGRHVTGQVIRVDGGQCTAVGRRAFREVEMTDDQSLETEAVLVRQLRPADLERVVALDARNTGRRREEYFRVKLAQALSDTGIQISLAAEVDEVFAGFCLARVYYGEFGAMEQTAVLDTFDVAPAFAGRGIGRALLRQLRVNLLGLGISRLQTEVSWSNQRILSFFQHAGFVPAPRIALDLDLEGARRREETRDDA